MDINDSELFANYYSNYLSEDGDIQFYENELRKDTRRNTVTGDLYQRYNDFRDYSSSQFSRDVDRVVNLLPDSGEEVAVKDLKHALQKEWYFDSNYSDRLIREIGSNDVRVHARNHAIDKSIGEIRLRKLTQ